MRGATSPVSPGRLVRSHPLAVDLAVATAACAAVLLNGMVHAGHGILGLDHRAGSAFVVAAYASMALRRRWPWASSVIAVAATTGYLTAGGHYWWVIPAPAIVLFHLASAGQQRVRLPVVAIACGVVLVGVPALFSRTDWWAEGNHEAGIAVVAACGIALAAGDAARNRGAYLAQLEQRARQAEDERARHARQQVVQERMRIARDLHDSVGHHIALINAQAGMATRVFNTQPDAAQAALAHITAESRAALDDIRATIGLLRQSEEPAAPTEPPAGLDAIDDLVERFKRSGMPVDLTVEGPPRPVPTAVDLAAYRIIQEALTNVTKHSAAAATRVHIDYATDAVTVLVDNDQSSGAGSVAEGDGHGLMGMRERATAAGGSLTAGPRPDGGYRVRAVLPLTRLGRS
jgi:signal transduction histidine kinase